MNAMKKMTNAMTKMVEEIAAGKASYHLEDDGEDYIICRNSVAIAGISHDLATATPALKVAIELILKDDP